MTVEQIIHQMLCTNIGTEEYKLLDKKLEKLIQQRYEEVKDERAD